MSGIHSSLRPPFYFFQGRERQACMINALCIYIMVEGIACKLFEKPKKNDTWKIPSWMPLYQRIDFLRNADGCIHIQMKMLRYNVFSCQEIYHGRLHFRQTVCAQPAEV